MASSPSPNVKETTKLVGLLLGGCCWIGYTFLSMAISSFFSLPLIDAIVQISVNLASFTISVMWFVATTLSKVLE